MFKMTMHVTQTFTSEAECLAKYNKVRDKLKSEHDLHLNCQISKKFTGYNPTFPEGHEVHA